LTRSTKGSKKQKGFSWEFPAFLNQNKQRKKKERNSTLEDKEKRAKKEAKKNKEEGEG